MRMLVLKGELLWFKTKRYIILTTLSIILEITDATIEFLYVQRASYAKLKLDDI